MRSGGSLPFLRDTKPEKATISIYNVLSGHHLLEAPRRILQKTEQRPLPEEPWVGREVQESSFRTLTVCLGEWHSLSETGAEPDGRIRSYTHLAGGRGLVPGL